MLFIAVISIILYIVSFLVIYYNINNFEKNKKVMFLIIGSIIMFILTYILCTFTSAKIDFAKKLVDITKITAILIFAPLNSIIFLAPIGNTISKLKNNEIKEGKLVRRIILIAVIAIATILLEFNYINNFQIELLNNTNF